MYAKANMGHLSREEGFVAFSGSTQRVDPPPTLQFLRPICCQPTTFFPMHVPGCPRQWKPQQLRKILHARVELIIEYPLGKMKSRNSMHNSCAAFALTSSHMYINNIGNC